ncbi:Phosphatidylinositol 3,4,5-trisphosphate-dependent Rac exchanger 1 protein, partial [Sciurus carolinensis]|nr:Phosphatidylinositol 3,4,5-trisphosphate-dependent Rac exchanger 1 protein [Sciurus carolinensis]
DCQMQEEAVVLGVGLCNNGFMHHGSKAEAAGLSAGQCILKVNCSSIASEGALGVLKHFQAFQSILEALAADDIAFMQNCRWLMAMSIAIMITSHYDLCNIFNTKLESIDQRITCYQQKEKWAMLEDICMTLSELDSVTFSFKQLDENCVANTNVFYHIQGSQQALKVVFYLNGYHFSKLPSHQKNRASLQPHTVLFTKLENVEGFPPPGRQAAEDLQQQINAQSLENVQQYYHKLRCVLGPTSGAGFRKPPQQMAGRCSA